MSYHQPGNFEPPHFTIWAHDPRVLSRPGTATPGLSTAWVANLAVFVPFTLYQASVVYEWFWANGALTTAHNVDFGIYDTAFNRLTSLGSTAGGTTATAFVNTSTFTDYTLGAGTYYMAMADDSTRNIRCSADVAGLYQAAGVVEQTTAFPLPNPASPVAYTRAFLPNFGMNLRNVAL